VCYGLPATGQHGQDHIAAGDAGLQRFLTGGFGGGQP